MSDLDPRTLFRLALATLPTHRDPPCPLEVLSWRLTQSSGLAAAEARGALLAVLGLLRTLGALQEEPADMFRLNSQTARYLLESLAWFARNDASVIDGWRGDMLPISGSAQGAQFDHAPHVLQALEQRRLRQAIALGIAAPPVREQAAVMLLIRQPGHNAYLHQFDARAAKYQLIGGRMEPGEAAVDAALRELVEEVAVSQPGGFDLAHVRIDTINGGAPVLVTDALSATYGALTRYTFYACRVAVARELTLGPHDRWFTPAEMCAGMSRLGDALSEPSVALALERLAALSS